MAQFTRIYSDAENECIVIKRVDETGADIADYPSVSLKLGDVIELSELLAKFRVAHFTSTKDGSAKRCAVLATKPEADAAGDDAEDLWLGGGVSSIQEGTILTLSNKDYFVARVTGYAYINVAKAQTGRMAFGPASYTAMGDNSRVADLVEPQVMDPAYGVGQVVTVGQLSVPIVVDGTVCNWIELFSERGWARQTTQVDLSGVTVVSIPA